jgi:Lrp/AsnC family transcriptional regulator, regulator for asnA, asnC and gidA
VGLSGQGIITRTQQKLILELQKDGRASYANLAAKLGITPSTAAKHVERLLASKIIDIRAVQNPFKMGLMANALIAIKADPKKIDDVCERLADCFHVNNVMTVFGHYDILIMVFFPTWELLFDFIHKELSNLEGVLQFETYQIREIKKRSHQPVEKGSKYGKTQNLKEIDWKLIQELGKDGRMNVSELSTRLGIHISTVSRRISALIHENFIKIQAVPNPSKFGYSSNAILFLDVDPARTGSIFKSLRDCPEVHLFITVINRSGVIVGIHAANNEMLYRFIKGKISPLSGILGIETFIRGEIKKRFYAWFLEEKEEL